MKNPLTKRLPRELKSEFGKYLVIFLLLIISIGFVSGFLVADGSMIRTYNEGFQKYNIENGHFQIAKKATTSQIQAIEENDITLYENFYSEESITNGSTLRIFSNRTDVNLVCLMKGDFPSGENEIAIDRMYADNNHLSVGDTLKSDSHEWTITGLVALPDYSCLFQNNNDSMFDSVKFGVAVVTPEAFSKFESSSIKYVYSWKYAKEPANDKEEKKVSDDLMKAINKEVSLQDYVPRYLNQAINFTGDDMGSDRAMIIVFLYIIIVIMAFVFGITSSNTIMKESHVIGTLLASGYTRAELIRHYIELRGIGVVDVQQLFGMSAVREDQDIDLVVNLEQWNDNTMYDRLGLEELYTVILDVKVPALTVPVKPGRNLAIIVEVAAMNNRHKKMGYNAAQAFTQQINEHFDQALSGQM